MHITFGKLFVLVNYEDSLSHFSSALVMKGSAKIIIFSHFCGTYPVTLISHSNLQPKKTVKVVVTPHEYWTKKKQEKWTHGFGLLRFCFSDFSSSSK